MLLILLTVKVGKFGKIIWRKAIRTEGYIKIYDNWENESSLDIQVMEGKRRARNLTGETWKDSQQGGSRGGWEETIKMDIEEVWSGFIWIGATVSMAMNLHVS